ncbi:MAG TPA: enoyl-CoA hydratase/isomerase family protein [Terriglobales bacterium]|nr:enoyl-CoA hydratase/isomerase family protein [Terriglobales bacterium]
MYLNSQHLTAVVGHHCPRAYNRFAGYGAAEYYFAMILKIDHGLIRELRLDRPPVNALSAELIAALRHAIVAVPGDGARALVISGSPGRFSGGLDIPSLLQLDRPTMDLVWHDFYGLLQAIAESPIPIATAITGHAPAGGTVLSIFCDWRVMAEGDFRIGLNEVQVGIQMPPLILNALSRLIGPRAAEHMAVGGELITVEQALRIGLIDAIAEPEQVVTRAIGWCDNILSLPPEAMLGTRQVARADLCALFDEKTEVELREAAALWWRAETQNTLRKVVEKLKTKKATS